jgi:hypothetical protein
VQSSVGVFSLGPTLDWYHLRHGSHFFAPWQELLGTRIFPDLIWGPVFGDTHSIAVGIDVHGALQVNFDILSFDMMKASEILERVHEKYAKLTKGQVKRSKDALKCEGSRRALVLGHLTGFILGLEKVRLMEVGSPTQGLSAARSPAISLAKP